MRAAERDLFVLCGRVIVEEDLMEALVGLRAHGMGEACVAGAAIGCSGCARWCGICLLYVVLRRVGFSCVRGRDAGRKMRC